MASSCRTALHRLLLLALIGPLAGCLFGLSEEEEAMLATHKYNSKIFYEEGDLARAEDQCLRGLEIDPDDRSLQLTLAFVYLRTDRLEEAQEILDDLAGFFSEDDYRVALGRGSVEKELARDAEAEERTEDARRHRLRAMEHLEEALELRSDCIEASFQLALLSFQLEDAEAFDRYSARSIELLRRSRLSLDAALERLAEEQVERRQRLLGDREVDRRRARQLLVIRAQRAWIAEDYAAAVDNLEVLEEFGDLVTDDYFIRARAREAVGDIEGAVLDFEQFVFLSTDTADPHLHQAVESLTRLRAELAERRLAGSESDNDRS